MGGEDPLSLTQEQTLMDALQLLTWSLILYLFASLASLFLLGLDRLAIKLSGITSLVAA